MKKTKWNPYNVDITVSDMHQIAKFFKIVKNYIKIKTLTTKTNNYDNHRTNQGYHASKRNSNL